MSGTLCPQSHAHAPSPYIHEKIESAGGQCVIAMDRRPSLFACRAGELQEELEMTTPRGCSPIVDEFVRVTEAAKQFPRGAAVHYSAKWQTVFADNFQIQVRLRTYPDDPRRNQYELALLEVHLRRWAELKTELNACEVLADLGEFTVSRPYAPAGNVYLKSGAITMKLHDGFLTALKNAGWEDRGVRWTCVYGTSHDRHGEVPVRFTILRSSRPLSISADFQ